MADLQDIYRKFGDLLPELAKVMTYDLERFETCRRDILVDYTQAFKKLVGILMTQPYEAQEEAIKVIRDFIASRQREYGQWQSAAWLAYMLGQVIERAKRRQRQKRHKPLGGDELPF